MKAKPGKAKAPAKTAKVATKAKPAAAKSAVKAPAKKVVVKKAAAKPVAKAASKPAPKKAAVKTSAAKKPAAKPAVKAQKAPAKPKVAAKAPPKKKIGTPVKAAAKPSPKTAPKAAAKGKAVSKPAKAPETSKAPVKAAVVKTVAPAAAAQVAAPAVPRRVSDRLAALTVPSMAQTTTTSTAAKSSFAPNMSTPVIIPPPFSPIKKDPKLANNWKSKPVEQLSDTEIVAMPDSEYMNEKQLAFFRLKLSVLKQDILNSAGETTEHLREDTVIVPDPADRATIEEEHALELRTRDRERKLLKKIEQSIMRIDAGDYGYCDETGEPIGVGRLLARPTATLSLEAQQRRELKQKMFGD